MCSRDCGYDGELVCGSDGLIYQNHCQMEVAACRNSTQIEQVLMAQCVVGKFCMATESGEECGGNSGPPAGGPQEALLHCSHHFAHFLQLRTLQKRKKNIFTASHFLTGNSRHHQVKISTKYYSLCNGALAMTFFAIVPSFPDFMWLASTSQGGGIAPEYPFSGPYFKSELKVCLPFLESAGNCSGMNIFGTIALPSPDCIA